MSEDDLPTRVERPAAERSTTSSPSAAATRVEARTSSEGGSEASSIATPVAALQADELERFRVFYWVILLMVGAMLGSLPFLGGSPEAKAIFAASLVGYAAGASWLRLRSRDPAQYHREINLIIGGLPGVFCGWAAMYYWGVFSPAPVAVAAALFINSLVGSRLYTYLLYGLLAGGHLLFALLVMAGVVRDVGLIHANYAPFSTELFTTLAVQFIMAVAFLGARMTRRVSLSHIAELERAARGMAQREVLLNEARDELKRAAWVGGPGRFTGQTIGSFQLGDVIGRGAMGEIYEAEQDGTGAPAAVKLLHRNVLADKGHVERFSREAEAAARLDSPHVVRVLEVGDPEAPTPYLAMERLRGLDLAAVLRHKRRLDLDEAVELVEDVARGLEAAGAAGIVHRDLKPHNIFRADQPGGRALWKILDFGVSKLAEGGGTLTSGAVVGTPSYMSPEQARGQIVDHRADVYALGAIAYRAITGHPPFPNRNIATTVNQVVYKMPERPGSLVPLAGEVDAVLAIALTKRREDRFGRAQELADALRAAVQGELDRAILHRAERLLARLDWGRIES